MDYRNFLDAFRSNPTEGNARLLASLMDEQSDPRAGMVEMLAPLPRRRRLALILELLADNNQELMAAR